MVMTGDRLKGAVTLSRTFNLGNFRSIRLEFSKEFYLEETTHEEVLGELERKISEAMQSTVLKEAQ